jgi:hypothetical protein
MKPKNRVGSLYLSDEVWDGLEQKAKQREISRSAVAEEILFHGLAIVANEPEQEPKEILSEPYIANGIPKTWDELQERSPNASFDLYFYWQYAEQEGSLSSAQCDKVCLLIALACYHKGRIMQPTAIYLSEQIATLKKYSAASVPVIRRETNTLFGRLQEIQNREDIRRDRERGDK